MTDKQQKEIAAIEANQAALRESIEASKDLAERAETLLKKHKKTLQRPGLQLTPSASASSP
jgi:hypothetical protein